MNYVLEIRHAVNFIESNLTADISLPVIASEVGLSMYHFHRVFQAELGESACEYLRKRRLTEAAKELRESRKKIADIALAYQFGSQEAFTRAFKAVFGLTPGEYRKKNQPLFIEKPPLVPDKIEEHKELVVEPQLIGTPEIRVVGIRCCSSFIENKVPEIWDTFLGRVNEIPLLGHERRFVGLYKYIPAVGFSHRTEFCYLAGTLVQNAVELPMEMVGVTVPAATWAAFRLNDYLSTREKAHQYIIGTWLPKSGYERAELPTLEVFRTNPADKSEYEILLPIG